MAKVASDTRTNILSKTLLLFLKKGYKDVSYQDLVLETGFSKGAIYHHFKSKDDLLASVFEYLLEVTRQPEVVSPEDLVTDKTSFLNLFMNGKKAQIDSFKKLMNQSLFELNKFLFFLEAISENEQLKRHIEELMNQEIRFLVQCFAGLEKHGRLPAGKDPALMAECLYWMLQGTEMKLFFAPGQDLEKDFLEGYVKTINDFFKII